MKFLFPILFLHVLSISYGQKKQSRPEKYQFFIDHADSLLKESVGLDEYNYCVGTNGDSSRMDLRPQTDSIGLLNKEWYIGELSFSDCPLHCELYKVNLQGTSEEEYVGVLALSPLMAGTTFIFVFDTDQRNNKFLGQETLSSFRNDCSVTFKKLLNNNCFEILTNSDVYRSIYMTEGVRIFHLENDWLNETLTVITYAEYEKTTETRTIKFQDEDGNGESEILMESRLKLTNRPKAKGFPGFQLHKWNKERRKYECVSQSRTKFH